MVRELGVWSLPNSWEELFCYFYLFVPEMPNMSTPMSFGKCLWRQRVRRQRVRRKRVGWIGIRLVRNSSTF